MDELEVRLKIVHAQHVEQHYYSGNCPNCGEVISELDTARIDYRGFCPECKKPIHVVSE